MITSQEAREIAKKVDDLGMNVLKAVHNSGLNEIRGALLLLASANEALAQELEEKNIRILELEEAAGRFKVESSL